VGEDDSILSSSKSSPVVNQIRGVFFSDHVYLDIVFSLLHTANYVFQIPYKLVLSDATLLPGVGAKRVQHEKSVSQMYTYN
jgi:hypothetical protein